MCKVVIIISLLLVSCNAFIPHRTKVDSVVVIRDSISTKVIGGDTIRVHKRTYNSSSNHRQSLTYGIIIAVAILVLLWFKIR